MKARIAKVFLNDNERDFQNLKSFIFPLRDLNHYLGEELPQRNINHEGTLQNLNALRAALVQEAVDDLSLERGISLDEERFTTTRLSNQYLLLEDRIELVDECSRMLISGMYGISEFTYFEHPWYYKLLDSNHLLLKIDQRDIEECQETTEPSNDPLDTASPSNPWSLPGTVSW